MRHVILFLLVGSSCSLLFRPDPKLFLEEGAERCSDRSDNDEDGLIDNQDPGCRGVEDLVTGASHNCARLASGSIRCWGKGVFGPLGYGDIEFIGDDELPSSADFVAVGGSAKQITAGGFHTCALLESGAARCWGNGEFGQLGYGDTNNIGDDELPSSVGAIDVGGPIQQIVAGGDHSCALLVGGKVRCWGQGSFGALGYGDTNNIGDDEPPSSAGDVDVGVVVSQLSAGASHTCALSESRRVRCWGAGSAGRLGYGDGAAIGDDEAPSVAGDVDVGGDVEQIAAGGFHTCALLVGGAIRCWGGNFEGELGLGDQTSIGDDEPPSSAPLLNIGGSAQQVATGFDHTCALLATGEVRCWGRGRFGQLGYGIVPGVLDPTDSSIDNDNIGDDEPIESVGFVEIGGPAERLSMGFSHTCAMLEGGVIRCWGFGLDGALGYGDPNDIGDDEVPSSVEGVSITP